MAHHVRDGHSPAGVDGKNVSEVGFESTDINCSGKCAESEANHEFQLREHYGSGMGRGPLRKVSNFYTFLRWG
jgi:hypothetical protein